MDNHSMGTVFEELVRKFNEENNEEAGEHWTPRDAGWLLGDPRHYDRGACVDLVQLRGFIMATQEHLVEAFALESDGPTRRQFLARLEKEGRQTRCDRRAPQGH